MNDIGFTFAMPEPDYAIALQEPDMLSDYQETEEERKKREEEERKQRQAAEAKLKREQTLEEALAEFAAAENALPQRLPTESGRGRVYIGPKISEEQFQSIPAGQQVIATPPPDLSPQQRADVAHSIALGTQRESEAAALDRLRAQDRPGTRTISVSNDYGPMSVNYDPTAEQTMRRYDAEQQYRWLTANGMSPQEALSKSGLNLFGGFAPAAQSNLKFYKVGNDSIVGVTPEGQSRVIVPPREKPAPMMTVTETIPGSPAVPEKQGLPEIRHWFRPNEPAVPGTPEIPATPSITRRYQVPAGMIEQQPLEVKPPEPATFSNEDEARRYGKAAGDIIYIRGVGRVRLR